MSKLKKSILFVKIKKIDFIHCRYPLRMLTELRPFRSTEFQKTYKHEPYKKTVCMYLSIYESRNKSINFENMGSKKGVKRDEF